MFLFLKCTKFLLGLVFREGPRLPALVIGATLLSSAMEILGVGIIFAFVRTMMDPEQVWDNPSIQNFSDYFEFETVNQLLIAVGIALIALYFLKSAIGFLALFARVRFAGRVTRLFSQDLMRHYVLQPYESLMRSHSSDFTKSLISESELLGFRVVLPALTMVSEFVLIFVMTGFLIWFNVLITSVVIILFTLLYIAIFLTINPRITAAGERRRELLRVRMKAAVEFFGGIREIKLSQRWRYYLHNYSDATRSYVRQQALLQSLPALPAFSMQALAVFCVVSIVIFYGERGQTTQEVIPTIALFAAASWRMMPSFNSFMRSFLELRGHWSILVRFTEDVSIEPREVVDGSEHGEKIEFKKEIELDRIAYTYPGSNEPAIQDITMMIKRGSSIGLVGPTGSGKSTLVELLLGLLAPASGKLLIDGKPLTTNELNPWQRSIGYVPQHIYLSDDSIRRNIAFGLKDAEINESLIQRAAEAAQIDSFIRKELPEGYDTKVGERGVRLSGGQLQRIGLARALYSEPELLVLDEATSALDSVNEELVAQAIQSLAGKITTVIIAHRISTIKQCDAIYYIEAGRVVAKGTFGELVEANDQFRRLAGVAGSNEAAPGKGVVESRSEAKINRVS